MRDQADYLVENINIGGVALLGQTLKDGWNLKTQLASGVSNPQIDEIYSEAMKAGALGGKITGAGGGGFFLVCVPPEKRAAVRQNLPHLRELPISLARVGSRVIFNVRT